MDPTILHNDNYPPKNAAYWKSQARRVAEERDRLRVVAEVAMNALDVIATTPRNKGAKRNAYATLRFLETQLDASPTAIGSGVPAHQASTM